MDLIEPLFLPSQQTDLTVLTQQLDAYPLGQWLVFLAFYSTCWPRTAQPILDIFAVLFLRTFNCSWTQTSTEAQYRSPGMVLLSPLE